ncbi:acyl-CoA dehydrogenase family protein [Nocardia colli]|uniref:Acyl-CoA dehydrogenase family protein n=1 Tax=Nocardia colli TaxID=2545717 RepID=A0A5N0DU18_9NOCA|nr:acyl-CoA dehydrogenase family protein [Nocardia colli]KAA8880582.1 acyl-CoA dehydrogenase family protein [Nocardia colli]
MTGELGELLLSHRQRRLVHEIRDHCTTAATADDVDADVGGPHSAELAAEVGARGWWNFTIDPRYGGARHAGGGFLDAALFAEEAFKAQLRIAGYIPTFIVVAALNMFGTAAQRADHFSRVVRGGVLAVSLTEPQAGSDIAAVDTRARLDDTGTHWVISGRKRWCSLANVADHILVFCRTAGESDRDGLSMIFVPRDADGLTIDPIRTPIPDLTCALTFDAVRVPRDALLGQEGAGFRQSVAGLNFERMIVAASSLGLAQRAFDDALAYVRERRQFGRPVGSFQAQQHRFAGLATELTKTRLLVHGVAAMMDDDPARSLPREASMAKLSATELAKRCALEGMQAMGANGYANEYGMERYLRAALGSTFFGGTSEIQRNIIAQTFGLRADN